MKWPSFFNKPTVYEAPAKGVKGATIRVSDKKRATAVNLSHRFGYGIVIDLGTV